MTHQNFCLIEVPYRKKKKKKKKKETAISSSKYWKYFQGDKS